LGGTDGDATSSTTEQKMAASQSDVPWGEGGIFSVICFTYVSLIFASASGVNCFPPKNGVLGGTAGVRFSASKLLKLQSLLLLSC